MYGLDHGLDSQRTGVVMTDDGAVAVVRLCGLVIYADSRNAFVTIRDRQGQDANFPRDVSFGEFERHLRALYGPALPDAPSDFQ